MKQTARLQHIWAAHNRQWFNGTLQPVPIRITRSRRTYGYFNGPTTGGRPSMRISTVLAHTSALVADTILHEMIHQQLHAQGRIDWEEHGDAFQQIHVRLFGEPYVEAV